MTHRALCITVTFLLLTVASGCTTSATNDAWGHAYEHNRQVQHGSDGSGPEGLDPVSAEVVAERYYVGQRTQATRVAPTVVISD